MHALSGLCHKVGSGLLILLLLVPFYVYGQSSDQALAEQMEGDYSTNLSLLIRLNKAIEQDRATLYQLRSDSSRLEPYFEKNTQEFTALNAKIDSLGNQNFQREDQAILELNWKMEKSEIDLLLQYRRSIHQRIQILDQKIEKMQEGVELITKGELSGAVNNTNEKNNDLDSNMAIPNDTAPTADPINVSTEELDDYNWRVVETKREIEKLKSSFEYTKKGWSLMSQLLNLNKDHLSITRSMLNEADEQINELTTSTQLLRDTLQVLQRLDSASRLQSAINNRINESMRYKNSIEGSSAQDSIMVINLEKRVEYLSTLREETTVIMTNLAQQIADKKQWLTFLKSPLAPHNIYTFIINKGPRIVLTLLFIFLIWFSSRWLIYLILKQVVQKNISGEREERIETLNRASRSAITILVVLFGTITILSEFGIDISVLLGGAAVFSLAIAFGAQSLVKDYFSGFMILTENQYRVGNVVRINQIEGIVEDISLRTTILRDLKGVAHFIPHGEITIVSNQTHIWSRVMLDIGVAYKENVDRVMEVIMHTARTMRNDPNYESLITEEPVMLGVDNFADSAVVIRLLIKTQPLKQWAVKRELLRRIKNRFDELGIEIPFPHRTVYHRDLSLSNPYNVKSDQAPYPNEADN